MTRTRISTFFLFFIILILTGFFSKKIIAEEILDEEYGYSLDVPEGFFHKGTSENNMVWLFEHDRMPVQLVIRIYSEDLFPTCSESLNESLTKLNSNFEKIQTFFWNGTDCAITDFSTDIVNNGVHGWAIAVSAPKKSSKLVLLCYADKSKANDCQQFLFSTLNSLELKNGIKSDSGIMTTFAFSDENPLENIVLQISGKKIPTQIKKYDKEACELVVKCEYEILKLYVNNKNWKEAWQRYYRIIYKDSFPRFNQIAKDIQKNLMPVALNKNEKDANAALNEILLDWVQNFEYKRQPDGTDFTNPISTIMGTASDCDSRSLLMCILLKQIGIDSVLFISNQYNHAVYGSLIDETGAKIEVNGKWYLLGETTAKNIKPGLIAADQNNTEMWIPVVLD